MTEFNLGDALEEETAFSRSIFMTYLGFFRKDQDTVWDANRLNEHVSLNKNDYN